MLIGCSKATTVNGTQVNSHSNAAFTMKQNKAKEVFDEGGGGSLCALQIT